MNKVGKSSIELEGNLFINFGQNSYKTKCRLFSRINKYNHIKVLKLLFKLDTIKSRQEVLKKMFTTSLLHLLIHSSSKHLLSIQYVPDIVLGPRDLAVDKADKKPTAIRVYSESVFRIYEELLQTIQHYKHKTKQKHNRKMSRGNEQVIPR